VLTETIPSKDGTRIASVRSGQGPPLVLVPGVTGDHTHFKFLAPLLEPHFKLWIVHRRGRGDSGDSPEYAIDREFEDLVAIVDSIGEPANVFGHSFGADVVLDAMPLTSNLRRAVIYEPAAGVESDDPTLADDLERLHNAGQPEAVLMRFHRSMPPEVMTEYRASPDFARDLALTHTMAREVRAAETWPFNPGNYRSVHTPTLPDDRK
jgi:pimeloyl-ACP methyl ester carboxylesterase